MEACCLQLLPEEKTGEEGKGVRGNVYDLPRKADLRTEKGFGFLDQEKRVQDRSRFSCSIARLFSKKRREGGTTRRQEKKLPVQKLQN